MNSKVKIKVKNELTRFFAKCIKNNINLYNIKYLDEETALIIVNASDYQKIKKTNYYCDINIESFEGLTGIKKHIKENFYFYLTFLFCFILMDIITSYIVDIKIIHENKNIYNLVAKELNNHNIKKYSLAYSFDELEKIKEEILNDNPTALEWISITRKGMKYIIRVEERIIKEPDYEEGNRHVVAKSDAEITKVLSTKGEVLVRSGDYVKKGDILISGIITLYDEVKGNTLATGTVYGNVWYNASIAYPINEATTKETGRKRYNLNINNKILLKNKYKEFKQKNVKEIKVLGLKIKIYEEIEYQTINKTLTKDELKDAALAKVKAEFKAKLKDEGTIEKVKLLEESSDEEYGYFKYFIVVNEVISKYEYYNVS